MKKAIVITTINKTNESLERFSKTNYSLIIIGDVKSPPGYDIECTYLNIADQKKLFPDFCRHLKLNHYSRKNIGYLYCYLNGCDIIAESDDDNLPYKNWGILQYPQETISGPKILNIFKLFTNKKIWPRGYPLELILSKQGLIRERKTENIMIMQGLVDGDTDTDALYRLIIGEKIIFDKNKSYALSPGVLSPFNTQNTFWVDRKAFIYSYLPSTVSFRYTDILRSFVAQYGIWKLGGAIGFSSPTVKQIRNDHNLLKDFQDEYTMYTTFHEVITSLEKCNITGGKDDILIMYESLIREKIVGRDELKALKIWSRYFSDNASAAP
jgi:hypothetical protein